MNNILKSMPLFSGPLVFTLILVFFEPSGLSYQGVVVLAATCWIALWWITEAIPISVTALLPIVLFPLAAQLDLKVISASYGHKYIFLYMGGFIIAIAIEKWNLHKRIALTIISVIGVSVSRIFLGFMLATAFMSMWISNTATSVMMLPIGLAIITQLKENSKVNNADQTAFSKGLMLAIAYSASIGGMASLIGTPPNLVLAGVIDELYGVEISFAQWFKFGFPVASFLLIVGWFYLTKLAFPTNLKEFPGGAKEIERLKNELGKITYEEKIILAIFVLTAVMWIFRAYLQRYIPALDDSIIAVMASILLFIVPAKGESKKLVTWDEAVKLPWGIIILFGGGIAIASAFQISGLAVWLGEQLSLLNGISLFLLIFTIVASVNFLTEITSNLATTAMLLPILGALAVSINVHPFVIMAAAAVAASCAFMLPVATPPNAVVFGSGYLTIRDMFYRGFWMNIISIITITLAVYFLLPWLWDIQPDLFPVDSFSKE